MLVSRVSVIAIGLLGILLGLAFEKQNVVFVTTMALAVAGSVNAPLLLASLFWRGLTTRGAIAGSLLGLTSSVGLIIVGPQVWVPILGMEEAIFPWVYPTVVSAPLAFVALWLFSVTDKSKQAELDRRAFDELLIRSETGIGKATAASH